MHVQMYAWLVKRQKETSHENITWSEMGKQNVQAEKVYPVEFTVASRSLRPLAAITGRLSQNPFSPENESLIIQILIRFKLKE